MGECAANPGLGADGYRLALESDAVKTPERLFRLRLLTFWHSNHRNRNPRKKKVRQKVPWETMNVEALLEMRLQRFAEGHDAADAIATAEIHRELGAFRDCLAWLDKVEAVEGIAPYIEKIGELARAAEVRVERVEAPFAPDDRKRAEPLLRILRKLREEEEQVVSSPRPGGSELPVVLVTSSRPAPYPGVEYVAYFEAALHESAPQLLDMMRFAQRIGSCLSLSSETRPFAGMKSAVALGTLTESEASEFKRLFSPDIESSDPDPMNTSS